MEEKPAGGGVDHHNSDCQEGVKGGLGSGEMRNQDGEVQEHGIVMACGFACWSSDQLMEFRGFHKRKRGCLTWRQCPIEELVFAFGHLFLLPLAQPGTKLSLWH